MAQEKERANTLVSKEFMQKIKDLAEKEQRKVATMVRLLLEYAVKEKTRKR